MRRSNQDPPSTWYPPAVCTAPGDDRQSETKLFALMNRGVPRPFDMLDQTPARETKSICRASNNPERWWIVTLTAVEVARISMDPLIPLSRNEIIRHDLVVPSTRLRAAINWGRAGQGHSVDVDIGSGLRLGIEGCEVDVRVCGPRGRMREVPKDDVRTLGEPGVGGVFIDTLLTATIVPSPAAPSARCPTLTQVVNISPLLPNRSVPIPRFARRLTIVRSGTDVFGTFSFRVGTAGASLRDFTFLVDDPNATPAVLIPQVATHVTTGPASPVLRVLTFQWELDL